MNLGSSKHQKLKNEQWRLYYLRSLFYQYYHRFPKNEEYSSKVLFQPINKELKKYPQLDVDLWSKSSPYWDKRLIYIIDHSLGIVYIVDKKISDFPQIDNYHTVYKNRLKFKQYIENKLRRRQKLGTQTLVGRGCSPFLFIKQIGDDVIHRMKKKAFADLVKTRLSNLNLYYDKVRGHKGFWISPNPKSLVFNNPKLPKYGHYSKRR